MKRNLLSEDEKNGERIKLSEVSEEIEDREDREDWCSN